MTHRYIYCFHFLLRNTKTVYMYSITAHVLSDVNVFILDEAAKKKIMLIELFTTLEYKQRNILNLKSKETVNSL